MVSYAIRSSEKDTRTKIIHRNQSTYLVATDLFENSITSISISYDNYVSDSNMSKKFTTSWSNSFHSTSTLNKTSSIILEFPPSSFKEEAFEFLSFLNQIVNNCSKQDIKRQELTNSLNYSPDYPQIRQ